MMIDRRRFIRGIAIAAGVGGATLAGLIAYPYVVARAQKELMISGSVAVSRFVALLIAPFIEKHTHVKVAIEGGGSIAGLVALDHGGIDLAMMSRDLNFEEFNLDLHSNLIGIEGVAIVVHPSMNINGISLEHLDGIFEGSIVNWNQIGGPNKKINVYNRNEGSTTRAFVEDVVMKGAKFSRDAKVFDSAAGISDAIAEDSYGIGYLTNKNLSNKVKAVAVNGVAISDKTLLLKLYPLYRDMFLVSKNSASSAAKDFVRYSLSAKGQEILVKHGLTQVSR
ncbi:phosphate ABC transporter substrate-binding protein [Polynucleobacter sp. AP-Titi-500A-B4]|uniref:phosphate ABC transporter substrate-binding protein n=1 Tax=Polynucleobacter sp. AP-Titi-500A-B4 TaxID=2576923 RepID=UPI001BFD2600|nr:phosphate ABC transporter substrate-binding protein [Polynucleobacter sp. AP-Titi-500A-B4]QWE11688.1 phosphate ABC transporter substrate-binding protein [Polynucleobacter sp. AP-Titi-500A-B4]